MSTDRVLVTYCSRTGATQSLAEVVGAALTGAGAQVDLRNISSDPDPAAYRAVVIGSALRSGAWYRPASLWLIKHHDALSTTPFAVFTVGLHVRDEAKRAAVLTYGKPLLDRYGLHPVGAEAFAGWWKPERFGWQERLLTIGSKEETGDWRDVDAVRAWSVEMASALRSAGVADTVRPA